MILVTGGASFIGANFVLDWLAHYDEPVVNLDQFTYAGNLQILASLGGDRRHIFLQGDIENDALVSRLLSEYRPRAVINFAAESLLSHSIHRPGDFIQTSVVGSFHLLESVRAHRSNLEGAEREAFRLLHVSTEEVYGYEGPGEPDFADTLSCEPNSPYSAKRAASDHLARTDSRTFGPPVMTAHCNESFGPYRFREKLISLMIRNSETGQALPVNAEDMQVGIWLHVKDQCSTIQRVLEAGGLGKTNHVGGWKEKPNIEIDNAVCAPPAELRRPSDRPPYPCQSSYVKDRPDHDLRYAIDTHKQERELDWNVAGTNAWSLPIESATW